MRKRNSFFSEDIGNLLEEINNEDLEKINGGNDDIETVSINTTVLTVITKPGEHTCPDIPKITFGNLCDESLLSKVIPC